MNFGADKVYVYNDGSEEECVSDGEYDDGMARRNESCSDSSGDEGAYGAAPTQLMGASLSEPSSSVVEKKDEERPKRHSGGFMAGLSERILSGSRGSRRKEKSPPPPPPAPPVVSAAGAPRQKKRRHHWKKKNKAQSEPAQRYTEAPSASQAGRRWRRADTNVILVKFDQLKSPSNMHTGDPFLCAGCGAVLSKLSKLEGQAGEDRAWRCEFCNHNSTVDLMDEEVPQAEDVTFMLQPAKSTLASGPAGSDQSLVVFCVDISGSMCVTTEVPGKMRLRGNRLERLQALNERGENQYLPNQRRDVTFVSRLQAVQAAVDHQLEEICKDYPNRRVCLITFNTEVTIIGDGSGQAVVIAGAKLSSKDELIREASELPELASIKDKREQLGDKLFDLEEGGMTALGPALLMGVSLASQVAGSKVIICTDGLANVGLGNLDELHSDDVYAQSASFYTDVSDVAVDSGVSVSVLSISGEKCRLVELGKVAEATGGQVNIVDPMKLTQEFGTILADPIIATNVRATLQIHSGLYLRNEETRDSKVTKYIGNVTKETECTFEYGVRKRAKRSKPEKVAVYDNAQARYEPSPSAENEQVQNAQNEAMEQSGTTDAPLQEKMETPIQEKMETPIQEKMETPIQEKMETPIQEKMETPIQEKMETPIQEKMETPIQEKMETPIQEKMETPIQEKMETPIQEKMETPIQEKMETIAENTGAEASEANSLPVENASGDAETVPEGMQTDAADNQCEPSTSADMTKADAEVAPEGTDTANAETPPEGTQLDAVKPPERKPVGNTAGLTDSVTQIKARIAAEALQTENQTAHAQASKQQQPQQQEEAAAARSREAEVGLDLKELPFQLQILYTDLEGAQALRVITQSKPVTRQREEAEQYMNMPVLGAHAAQTTARIALQGEYTGSRMNAFMYQRLLHRGKKSNRSDEAELVYDNFKTHVGQMENVVLQQQQIEVTSRGRNLSDSEDEDTVSAACASEGAPRRSMLSVPKSSKSSSSAVGKKGVRRRMDLDDRAAENWYSNAQLSSHAMLGKGKKK